MDELLAGRKSQGIEFFLQKILDRFHVMVGRLFDLLDLSRIIGGELPVDHPELLQLPRASTFFNWGSGISHRAMKYSIFHLGTRYFIRAPSEK